MRKWRLVAAATWWLWLSGCAPLVFFGAGAASGVAGYMYLRGALVVTYQAPYVKTWDATLKALEGMGLRVEKKSHGITKGEIEAKKTDDTPVVVSIQYKSAQETEVSIRVGAFGDEPASLLIKEEIRKELFK